ncbi:transposase [Vreelandella andesensis]|uniref:Transposase n=1 Tax=Vreelandella andesensis TaxID=447567 RepID=A0A3S0W665_9GAMM|nr:transposase [Halomonas andesensis]RUR29772.1 transposase [Halomonas andesensis]
MKVTRVLRSENLNRGKYAELLRQAELLGGLRSEVWQRYGSVAGVGLGDRKVRDSWLREGRSFTVPANAWKETLRDAMADIKAYREAAKDKVKQAIRLRTTNDTEQKRLYTLLKSDKWLSDPFLRRQMRIHFKHGRNKTFNQIVVRSDNYTVFEQNGRCWIKVPSLAKGRRLAIPLKTTIEHAPTGTLRLILKGSRVEVHSQVDVAQETSCGDQVVGIDKGYSEVFVDSDGESYGEGLGKLISKESDYLNQKYVRRNKLRAIARKKPHKRVVIEQNNLDRKKLDRRQDRQVMCLKMLIYSAAHALVNKAGMVVCEDLTSPIASKKNYGRGTNRRLNTWTKGLMAEALDTVSQRRGSSLHLVNAAYTSQADSFNHGLFTGTRVGDKFYRESGDVVQADHNAARNVLARLSDPEIERWTPFTKVKSILQARTDRYRTELTVQGSSYTPGNGALTECELVLNHV